MQYQRYNMMYQGVLRRLIAAKINGDKYNLV